MTELAHRPLGQTGMQVSVLGLGTVKLGRNQGVRYPSAFALPSDAAVTELLACAADLGINLLDTAPAYGSSEERLGQLLTHRERWLLCSKVGETFTATADQFHSDYDFQPAAIEASVTRSLKRLHTDYLDIVLIHSDGDDLDILDKHGALATLQELKRKGLIRAVGMSHKTIRGAQRALELGADVLMATLNAQQQEEVDVIAQAGRTGCGVLIKKALASGHTAPADQAAALRRVAATPGVTSLVVGTINPVHLQANAQALI